MLNVFCCICWFEVSRVSTHLVVPCLGVILDLSVSLRKKSIESCLLCRCWDVTWKISFRLFNVLICCFLFCLPLLGLWLMNQSETIKHFPCFSCYAAISFLTYCFISSVLLYEFGCDAWISRKMLICGARQYVRGTHPLFRIKSPYCLFVPSPLAWSFTLLHRHMVKTLVLGFLRISSRHGTHFGVFNMCTIWI